MISVALCTYNGSNYISDQLLSIINQSKPVDEIVICDDASTDGTVEIVESILSKSEIKYHVVINKNNLGVTGNFQQALSICAGDIIFLSDQDDIWEKNKVEIISERLRHSRECLLVFSDAYLIDKDKKIMHQSLWENIGYVNKHSLTVTDFLGKRFVTGATVAMKRELLNFAMPIPDSWIHDAWLAVLASIHGNVIGIDIKTIRYRQHDKNVIGVQTNGLIRRMINRGKNIEESIAFRNTMVNRFQSLVKRESQYLSIEERSRIEDGIIFWKESSVIGDLNAIKAFAVILNNVKNGNYKKFNNGIYGALVDIYILVSKRMRRLT